MSSTERLGEKYCSVIRCNTCSASARTASDAQSRMRLSSSYAGNNVSGFSNARSNESTTSFGLAEATRPGRSGAGKKGGSQRVGKSNVSRANRQFYHRRRLVSRRNAQIHWRDEPYVCPTFPHAGTLPRSGSFSFDPAVRRAGAAHRHVDQLFGGGDSRFRRWPASRGGIFTFNCIRAVFAVPRLLSFSPILNVTSERSC